MKFVDKMRGLHVTADGKHSYRRVLSGHITQTDVLLISFSGYI